MGKKKKEVTIEIIGGNAEGVTGSCTRIKTSEHCYLFETNAKIWAKPRITRYYNRKLNGYFDE